MNLSKKFSWKSFIKKHKNPKPLSEKEKEILQKALKEIDDKGSK